MSQNPDPNLDSIPSAADQEISGEVSRKFQHSKQKFKLPFERTWFVSNCFVLGQHYVSYNDVSQTYQVSPSVPEHRKRAVINWPLAFYRRTKSKLSAGRPILTVYPATSEQDDKNRAKLSNLLLDYLWERLDIQGKRADLIGWMLKCGSAFYHPFWNPHLGVDIDEGIKSGDIDVDIVSPLEIVVDPYATNMDNAQWTMRSRLRTLDWIKRAYPKVAHQVQPDKEYSATLVERKFANVVGVFGFTGTGQVQADSNARKGEEVALVHEYWERESAEFSKGRLLVTCGNTVLLSSENPHGGDLPFIKIDEISIEGRFWGMATVEQMIPLCRNLNKARSEQMENRILSRPKVLKPRVCKVAKTSFNNEAGEVLEYDSGPLGESPSILNPSPPSGAHIEDIKQTTQELQEITGWHEVSRGILPSADTSGKAIALLQMSDDTQLGATMRQIERGDQRLGRWFLRMGRKYYTEERLVRVVGKNHEMLVERVQGKQLAGDDPQADYFDVRVQAGSGFHRDKSVVRDEIGWALSVGLLDPVKDKRRIAQMAEFGTIDDLHDDDDLDEQMADRENDKMSQGFQIMPREWEDHASHISRHVRYQKTLDYQRILEKQPEINDLFKAHLIVHMSYLEPGMLDEGEPDQEMAPEAPMEGEEIPPGPTPDEQITAPFEGE